MFKTSRGKFLAQSSASLLSLNIIASAQQTTESTTDKKSPPPILRPNPIAVATYSFWRFKKGARAAPDETDSSPTSRPSRHIIRVDSYDSWLIYFHKSLFIDFRFRCKSLFFVAG